MRTLSRVVACGAVVIGVFFSIAVRAQPVTADLAVTKTDGVTTISAGGTTTYIITITNNGPGQPIDATVTDVAPPGLTFGNWSCAVISTGSAGGGGGGVTTGIGTANGSGDLNTTVTMQFGAVIACNVNATVACGATGSISNTATVAVPAGMTDPDPSNNSATDTDTISGTSGSCNPQASKPIPTLSEWALLALALTLAAIAMLSLRSTRQQRRP